MDVKWKLQIEPPRPLRSPWRLRGLGALGGSSCFILRGCSKGTGAKVSGQGFDYREIQESIKKNWEEKGYARGASTITQQLAKNLYLSPSKNPARKLKEAVLTYRLERALSKNRILELYLNLIEWGDAVFGAEAAAQAYLGKSASELDVCESAMLAAMIVNPIRYSPLRNSATLLFRYNWILDRLHESGKLDDQAFAAAKSARVALRGGAAFP